MLVVLEDDLSFVFSHPHAPDLDVVLLNVVKMYSEPLLQFYLAHENENWLVLLLSFQLQLVVLNVVARMLSDEYKN